MTRGRGGGGGCGGVMLGVGLATCPALVLVLLMQHSGPVGIAAALIFSGAYILTVVLGMSVRRRLLRAPEGDDDEEDGDQTSQVPEDDNPPSYDIVVAKPPPYDLLYVSSLPTYGDATGHVPTDTTIVPVHHHHQQEPYHKRVLPWTLTQPEDSPTSSRHVFVFLYNDTTTPLTSDPQSLPVGDAVS